MPLYRVYSQYLKEKYGEKVYKLPLSLPCTCPNRDGTLSDKGCIFCGEKGTGFEMYHHSVPLRRQIEQNRERIGKGYGAKKFIAYFQNYTNTYLPVNELEGYIRTVLEYDDIVEICLSTRPDCINDAYLQLFEAYSKQVHFSLELGLQSVNYRTLRNINRGHTLAEFLDAVLKIKQYHFPVTAHVILNLPWDDTEDAVECAKILSALRVDMVKLHSLYILKESELGRQFERGEITLISKEEYIERVITFLRFLSPDIVIQRLLARAPEGDALFCNWDTSWWKIKDEIELRMKENNFCQGDQCNYLDGSALKKINH